MNTTAEPEMFILRGFVGSDPWPDGMCDRLLNGNGIATLYSTYNIRISTEECVHAHVFITK